MIGRAQERPTRYFQTDSGASVFVTILLAHLAIAVAVGVEAWDDGFITLSLSRTFAETGHIGLTPASEQVEAATSPLWFLMMAGLYKIGFTGFYWFHFVSQLTAALCSATAAMLFYRLIHPAAPAAAWWITILTFLLGPIRAETGNGMEMSGLCLVVVGILFLLSEGGGRRWVILAALAAAVPWLRLEATGYVIAGVFAVLVFSPARNRRSLGAIVAALFASVGVLALVRYKVFGTVLLTNTMIAKQLPPYSPPFPSPAWWGQQVTGFVIEPVVTALPAVVVLFILLRMTGQRFSDKVKRLQRRAMTRDVPLIISFSIGYSLAFFGFTGLFGANTFTLPGRMGMSAMILLVAAAVHSVPVRGGDDQALPRRSKIAIAALFLVPFVGLLNYDTIGLAMRGTQLVKDGPWIRAYSFSAFHANGLAIDRVRQLLGAPEISVLLADVGQPGLCCQRLKILDFGLLANSELTKTGWDGFADYLRRQKPDIIQLHSSFTQESGITHDDFFTENYRPVFVDRSLLYLRNDHYDALKDKCQFGDPLKYYFFSEGEPLTSQTDMPTDSALYVDKDYLASLGIRQYCRLS